MTHSSCSANHQRLRKPGRFARAGFRSVARDSGPRWAETTRQSKEATGRFARRPPYGPI